MSRVAIRVKDVSKQYRIGVQTASYATFRETLVHAAKAPIRRFRRLSGRTGSEMEMIWALRNVTFELSEGEVLGIIGPNGSGKSTLLKILCRVTRPTSGRTEAYGRIGSLLEVGTGFHQELTGRENVFLNGAILGMTKAEINKKFDEIVDFSGVEKYLDTPVKRYSSGMQVRLAFSVAAHLETEILLMDEVLAVGDVEFQKKCMGKMEGAARSGRTVVFVSHNMTHITNLCPRSIMLQAGRIAHDGPSQEVVDAYRQMHEDNAMPSLRDRKDRSGNGLVCIVDAWVEDERGQRVQRIASGDCVKLVAQYEIPDNRKVNNVDFAFGIHNSMGVRIAVPTFSLSGRSKDLGPGSGRAECLIPRFSLGQGSFFFNVMVCSAHAGREIFDHVRNAYSFQVETGDYYMTGRIPTSSVLVHMDHHWTIVDD